MTTEWLLWLPMVFTKSVLRGGGGGGGRFKGICGYCNKRGLHENECFKKKFDNERAHVTEGEDNDGSGSKEYVMMMYEPYDCFSDESDDKCIDFEAEEVLQTVQP